MPGGLMQLVAYGSQDLYLTGNPQMTYFKAIYRRHTNFATEYIRLDFETLPSFSTTSTTQARVKIPRHAELVHDCYFVIDMPPIYGEYISGFKWVDNLGFNLINNVSLTIAGAQIDKHYGKWLIIWNELTLSDEKKRNLYKMISMDEIPIPDQNLLTSFVGLNNTNTKGILYSKKRLRIPMFFWFCTNPGLSLPLISLQYNEVYINFEFVRLNDLFTLSPFNFTPEYYFSSDGISNIINYDNFLKSGDVNFFVENHEYNTALNEIYTPTTLLYYFLSTSGTGNLSQWIPNPHLEANYIYLDEGERKLFAKYTQEYLITQVQYQETPGLVGGANVVRLKFNHPVKELVWTFRRDDSDIYNNHNNYTYIPSHRRYKQLMEYLESMGNGMVISSIANSIMKKEAFAESLSNVQFNQLVINLLKLNATDSNNITDNVLNIFQNGKFKFNGKDRFREKDFKFFTESQIWSKQSGNPVIPGINCYSFALKPEKHQPSGTCNFSRLDKVEFLFTLKKNWRNVSPNASIPSENIPHVYTFSIFKQSHIPTQDITNIYNNLSDVQIDSSKLYILDMYAVNYNILRIMGGMGDVAFAN
tara:strand:- start:4986 stop:6749 length:1764 start_codon:yes stop_codon:yes gene_type:complete